MQSKDEIPHFIIWEIARVRQIDSVQSSSLKYFVDSEGRANLSFDIETDVLIEPSNREILDIEPIVLRYSTPESVGFRAPEVLSGRRDFSRDLPHLFPSSVSEPVSFCLARTGLQAIYDSFGVKGVIARLLEWLSDAKTETLYEDGWDPVPLQPNTISPMYGYIDTATLQQHASENVDGGYEFIGAKVNCVSNAVMFVDVADPIINTSDARELESVKKRMRQTSKVEKWIESVIPAIFVWPSRDDVQKKPRFNTWCDFSAFKEGLQETQLDQSFDFALDFVKGFFSTHDDEGEVPDLDGTGSRSLVVIVGLWRPVPIDETIVGLTSDPDSRSLEIRAFYLQRPIHEKDLRSSKTNLFQLFGLERVSPTTLQAVSGVDKLGSMALLGAGALGSAYLDYALRGGTNQITVIDNDSLLPHNIARHRGDLNHVLEKKTDIVQDLANKRLADSKVKKFAESILSLNDENLAIRFCDVDYVIDATANPLVRRRLSSLKGIDLPVMRSEIFHRGRLGVSLITKLGTTQNLNCLFHQLVALAMDNSHVSQWLDYENSRTYKDEELLIGFGCYCRTTRLPLYIVDAHAVSSFAVANQTLQTFDRPLIVLHTLDEKGLSQGTQVIQAEPVQLFENSATSGWRVIVANGVLKSMGEFREKAVPNETGGYFYGALDEHAREIYVVAVSSEPPGTSGTPTSLQLGRYGLTGFEKTFARRTRNRLPPIGAWHSHPDGGPAPSCVDMKTFCNFAEEDSRRGLPTVMAISAPAGETFVVRG